MMILQKEKYSGRFLLFLLITKVIAILFFTAISTESAAQHYNLPQPPEAIGRDTVYHLKNIDVKKKRKQSGLSVAVPQQTLERANLERMGIQSLADALKQFPGVTVRDYGGVGGLKTVSVRGLDATMTGVAVDGIAIGNISSGQVDLGQISLSRLEQISLTGGSPVQLDLPARIAMNPAALMLTSRHPVFDMRNSLLNVSLRAGSYGLINPVVYAALRLSEHSSIAWQANWEQAFGNYPFTVNLGKRKEERKRTNSDVKRLISSIDYFGSWRNTSITLQTSYLNSNRGLPGSVVYYNDYNNERLWDQEIRMQGRWEQLFDNSPLRLNVYAKYNHHYTHYRDISNKYEDGEKNDKYWENEYYLSASLNNANRSRRWHFAFASDYWYNTLTNTLPTQNEPARHTAVNHLQARYQGARIIAIAGVLSLFTHESVKEGDAAKNRYSTTGHASLIWKPWESEYIRFRTSWKQIYRLPTFNELYYDRIGNNRLNPEKGHQFNLGVTYQAALSSWFTNLSLSVDAYKYNVRDKIVAIPTMFIWRMVNLDKVNSSGIDLSVQTSFRLKKNWELFVNGNYSYQKVIDVTNPSQSVYKAQIPYIPRHSGSLQMLLSLPVCNISYNMIASGVRYSSYENTVHNRIKAYRDHTVSVSVPFSIKKHEYTLQATVRNLTDKNYEVIRFYPMPGRTYELKLTYQIN